MYESAVKTVIQLSDSHLPAREDSLLRGVDVHVGLRSVLMEIDRAIQAPEQIIHTGDLIENEAPGDPVERRRLAREAYAGVKGVLGAARGIVHCVPGNHDVREVMTGVLGDGVLFMEKRILAGKWQILLLDSSLSDAPGGHLPELELAFLDAALSSDRRHALVFMHHAPVSIGSAWLDTMVLDNAKELLGVVERHSNVRGIVFGHIHQEFESRWGEVALLGAPSTGWQFVPGTAVPTLDPIGPGFRSFELRPDGSFSTRVHRCGSFDPVLSQKSIEPYSGMRE